MKGYTSFWEGFIPGLIQTKPSGETKYLDWVKAKQLIEEHPNSVIHAGLMEDWNNTSGLIYAKGNYYNGYVYGMSYWATPILDIDGEEFECWTYTQTKELDGKPDWLYGDHVKDVWEFDNY